MELLNYLQGLLKGILKTDELHVSQIELIISEAIESIKDQVSEVEIEILQEKLSKFKAAEHTHDELVRAIQCYSPVKVKIII